ncbi:dihydrodipicolinate synthase family protein [Rubinisphaera margarita]|uniref:dihydrodipicolinate synthase family protein n=1 Tax=Rubinisphaera margarita TaxID=2909586 RepID=UPI001EE86035|nr:dihydrodipicolinate synthase family protein [Rubinisphaera margarita]MCG6156253.1 dihydrodipicolinate synthase family protein [Rubinisphaera margarita]
MNNLAVERCEVSETTATSPSKHDSLLRGLVIPACPLALTAERQLNEQRQRALIRYYAEAGAGGLAICVHTTQFEVRDPAIGLYQPLLEVVADELNQLEATSGRSFYRVAGVCGLTSQALAEAQSAADLGYDAALLNLGGLKGQSVEELLNHCRTIASTIPIFGFYLQEACGGRPLPFEFWKGLCELPELVGIKIACFNRYQTLDVLRAVAASGRDDIALYTGNDDNIVADLLTPYRFEIDGRLVELQITGGLLGQWAVWTRRAVELLNRCRVIRESGMPIPRDLLRLGAELTDANQAIFDATHGFQGCVPGIHYVLVRQGLLEGNWLLDPDAGLSPGQAGEIERICHGYAHLSDDNFVRGRLDDWLV